MKRFLTVTCLMFLSHAVAGAPTAQAQAATGTTAMTAEVLSFETQSRIMVVRGPDGASRRLMLDDIVAGFGGLRAGDRVVVTVRDEPGMDRVSSLVKSNVPRRSNDARPATALPSSDLQSDLGTSTPDLPPLDTELDLSTRSVFSQQVSALAARANAVDLLWGQFRTACDVRTSSSYEDAREWFGLWDGRVRADLSIGFCRDLFNDIVDAGASINASMAAAEESADHVLLPGTMRDIRRRNAMDWEGWSLSRPDRVER